jgi:hypothetical protein
MRVLSAVLFALLTFSIDTAAQTGWSGAVVDLSPPGVDAGDSVVAVDAAGNAMALWKGNASDGIQAARFSRASGTWSPAVSLSAPGVTAEEPKVAFDPGGNAIAIWFHRTGSLGTGGVVQTARYAIATNTWSAPTDLPGGDEALYPDVVIDAAGNATAVWSRDQFPTFVLRTARYTAATGTWGSVVDIANTGNAASGADDRLVVDGNGNVTVVWTFVFGSSSPSTSQYTLRAARYLASSGTWTAASDLASTFGVSSSDARLGVDATGNLMAIWSLFDGTNYRLQSARFTVASNIWSVAANIPGVGPNAEDEALAVAPNGDAMVVWSEQGGSDERVHAIRYLAATGTWSGVATISPSGRDGDECDVAVDPAGNAIVIWTGSDGTAEIIQAARYTRATDTWSIPTELSATGEDADDPLVAFDSAGNATAIWERETGSLDVVQATRWLAAAAAVTTPTNLVASSIVGNTVTIAWNAPSAGATPTEYVLEGGVSPGQVLASVLTGSAATTFTFTAPTGVFYIRIHALAGATTSAASNEIRIAVNVPTPPSPPINLAGQANGSSLSLTWQNTAAGGTPTAIRLEVTGTISTSLTLPATESFAYAAVPNGTYTFTVRASNTSGVSAASNPVTLTFPGLSACAPPGVGVPTNFVASKSGNIVSVSWAPPATGPLPTSYSLFVTGSFVGSFSTTALALSGPAPAGSYTLSVVARNDCGSSPATPAQTVTIP